MRVLVAMSGGVDSSTSAALLLEQGYEVEGVHLSLWKDQASLAKALKVDVDQLPKNSNGCSSPRDLADAQDVCDQLGIPLKVWDLAGDFQTKVVEPFVQAYSQGLTPNPCVRCNQHLKMAELIDRAVAEGFDYLATGHYARVLHSESPEIEAKTGGAKLLRARNMDKDQSYLLSVVSSERLAHLMLPLGDYENKAQVRQEARRFGLSVASRPDSYDICFIPDGDTQGFLRRHLGEKPGEIVDEEGSVLAQHRGTFEFTVGQRKGLGIDLPAPDGAPRYVLSVDSNTRKVVVGPKAHLATSKVAVEPLRWLVPPQTVAGQELTVQMRAHGRGIPVKITEPENPSPSANVGAILELATPVQGIAPGQSAVIYVGDQVCAQANIVRMPQA